MKSHWLLYGIGIVVGHMCMEYVTYSQDLKYSTAVNMIIFDVVCSFCINAMHTDINFIYNNILTILLIIFIIIQKIKIKKFNK